MLQRPVAVLRPLVMIGGADHCRRLVESYGTAGVERMFLWPLADEARQLENFAARVIHSV